MVESVYQSKWWPKPNFQHVPWEEQCILMKSGHVSLTQDGIFEFIEESNLEKFS